MSLLIGEFVGSSLAYLRSLVSDAPAEFYPNPKVYFSLPTREAVSNANQAECIVRFSGVDVLYNTQTQLTELNVFLDVVDQSRFDLATFSKKDTAADFQPYFCWILDPNRSLRVARYATSRSNVLHSDKSPLKVKLLLVDSNGPTANSFNPSVLDATYPLIP